MSGELEQYIKKVIREKGPVTFEEFMGTALYHEELGYYSVKARIGREGDFYTSASVNPVFGQMLARQLQEMWEQSGCPGSWHVVEFGPGEGLLSRDILTAAGKEYPAFFNALQYWCLEKSDTLAGRQQDVLQEAVPGKAKWIKSLEGVGEKPFTGCIFSNELIDAMPVHLVKETGQGLQELYVAVDKDGKLCWEPGPLSTVRLEEYFTRQGIALEPGQTAEVNLNALDWLGEVAGFLDRGFIMSIDYGTGAGELYDSRRFEGTLRCFSGHSLNTSPLENIGEQDITATVNFTALEQWGEETGLASLGWVPQSQFLINLGILEEIRPEQEAVYDRERTQKTMAVKQLILPGGMGEVFKVLVQYKGLARAPQLTGMRPGRGLV